MDSFEPHFHQLFVKQNETTPTKRDTIRPKDRTLFVLNVPPYIQKHNLQNAFEDAGQLEEIFVCDKPGDFQEESQSRFFSQQTDKFSFKCAYLVFKTSRGLQNALKLKQVASGPIKCGLQKWCDDYLARLPNPVELQSEIDSYIAAYDDKKQLEDEQAKNQEPDDDGWVTVTKKTHPVIEKKESVLSRIEQKEKVKKGKKELKDFYRFQLKDTKVRQLAQLRKRFDEDKKKVEILRNSRRFKPI